MNDTSQPTMLDAQREIDARVAELSKHPLFAKLDASNDIATLRSIAPHGYFYVLGFQDMLRLTHERITDPSMKKLALSLRRDDADHDKWFLGDMELFGTVRDVGWVFGPEHERVRDLVYGLIGEFLRASEDAVRLVFPLILEGAGTIFFSTMVGVTRRSQFQQPLRYFAPMHQAAEEAHEVFTEEGQEQLMKVAFDAEGFAAAVAMVERCFGHFEEFADILIEKLGAD